MVTLMLVKAIGALFFSCLTATLLFTPVVIRLARRTGAVDRGGYRKVFRGEMPLLGGLAVAAPLIGLSSVSAVLGHMVIRNWQWAFVNYREPWELMLSLASVRNECMTLAIGGVAIVVLGLMDDIKGLRARWKLAGQVLVALFVCLSGYSLSAFAIPFLGAVNLDPSVGGLLTVLWIVRSDQCLQSG